MDKYFPGNHPSLAEELDQFLEERQRQLDRKGRRMGAAAFILAGGYGRGEGGVFINDAGVPRLYNDLEFYLFTRGPFPTTVLTRWIHETERAGKAAFGIDVEIKTMPASSLDSARPSMFLYDLATGHVIVHGPRDFLTRDPLARLRNPNTIPLHEAARLLFNRGSGLFFAKAKLSGADPRFDQGFIQRNHAKAKLALGDAVLAANGLYDSSCRERERRITGRIPQIPPGWNEIRRLHTAGVLFKFNPRHANALREELEQQQNDLVALWSSVFLWLESLRLGRHFDSLLDYARCRQRMLPKFPLWKNPVLRLRDLLKYHEALPAWLDHPRAVLQRSLAAFLGGPSGKLDLKAGARILGVPEENAFAAYQRWWTRYN